jgi:hypothetical protein
MAIHSNMKTKFLLLFCFAFALSSCRDKAKEAVAYNDKIIAQEQLVVIKMNALDGALKSYKPAYMNKTLQELQLQTESSIEKLKGMSDFEGDVAFRDAAILYIDDLKNGVNEEMVRAVSLSSLPDSSFSPEAEFELHDLCMKNIQRSERAQAKFKLAQKVFADKFKFTLKEPEAPEKAKAKP